MKTKTYTKHKKNTKNNEWEKSGLNCTMPVKSVRLKDESQLDRIERKLDELLKRQPIVLSPQPMQWIVPSRPPEEPRYPTDPFGQTVPYATTIGGQ